MLTAISTALLVYVTYRLVVSTNKLWHEARETAERQERTTKILQRSYLHVLPRGIELTTRQTVLGHNSNLQRRTFTSRKVSGDAKIIWSDARSLSDFKEIDFAIDHTNFLAVGGEMAKGTGALGDGRSVLAAERGYIYVWGKVSYKDRFGQPRWLTFCHRYPCEASKTKAGGIAPQYARHHYYYNDAN